MELDERKKRILTLVVENYIESAEPVGSALVAKEYEHEFSSATIRNEMKSLEDIGLLEQPHISAGRVPSTKGYRYYVDNLMSNDTLSMVDIDYINNNIVSYGSVENTLENAAEVISKILKLPAVVNVRNTDIVEQIKILKISEKILLIILMSKSGTVKDIIVKITDSLPEARIEELSKLLNKNLKGTPLEVLPEVLNEIVHKELKKFSGILNEISKFIGYRTGDSNATIKGNISNLLTLPEFSDTKEIKKFLNIVNTKEIITEALDKIDKNDISIIIGSENRELLLKDYSLVSLDMSAEATDANIGVISPKRVDYAKTIKTLKHVNERLKKIFKKDNEFDEEV